MITEQHIRITAKMLECRDTMHRLWGEQYAERTEPFRDAIRRWVKESGKPVAEIALDVLKLTERHGGEMDLPLAISAAADAMEEPLTP